MKSLTDNAAERVQQSKSDWREFLRFFARLYKYSFSEALLIYEQAPNVTACGEVQHWNKVGRRIHRGTKGIPVINDTDRNMEIRYVFDVSDTYGEDRGIPRRWTLPDKYMDAVVNELQKRFHVLQPTDNQSKNLKWAVEQYVRESCIDYAVNAKQSIKDSYLNTLDIDDLYNELSDTVVDSVGYLISERLELVQGLYNDDELSFKYLHHFDSKSALYYAGTAVGQISRSVLSLVAETIRNEQNNERMRNNDDQRPVHDRGIEGSVDNDRGGNRSDAGESERGTATADGEIREPVLGLPEEESSRPTRVSVGGNDAAGDLPASRQGSAGDDGNNSRPAPPNDAEAAKGRFYGDGTVQHVDSEPSGGNRAERDSLQTEITTESTNKTTAAGENPPLSYTSEPTRGNTNQHRNYHALAALTPEIVSGEASFMRFTAGEAFMPLNINRLSGNRVSISHTYVQNGNLMSDPDMEFVLDTEAGTLSARTYQQDGLGLYQSAEGGTGQITNPRLARDLDSFTRQWLSNIKAQEYQRERIYVASNGDEIEVVYGTDGKITAINGWTEAIDAYVHKHGIELQDNENVTEQQPASLTDPPPAEQAAEQSPAQISEPPPDTGTTPFGSTNEPEGVFSSLEEEHTETAVLPRSPRSTSQSGEHDNTTEQQSLFDIPASEQDNPQQVEDAPYRKVYSDYLRLQRQNPDTLILYHRGDFYELYGEAAETAAKVLDLATTPVNAGRPEAIALCGFPAHTVDRYIRALIETGYTVSVSEPIPENLQIKSPTVKKVDAVIELFDEDESESQAEENVNASTTVSPALPKPPNFHITPGIDIGGGGAKVKYRRNIEAIRLLKEIETDNRYATPEEQAVMALYAGWGGISQVFKEGHPDWTTEYGELKGLLTEKEYRAAAGSTLNAHYTSTEVIGGIYAGLDRLGFKGGSILEPATGVGNFYGCMPEGMAASSRLYGAELDSVTGRIARQLYPNADIRVQGYETTSFQDNFFDAAVSNVPFGSYKVNDPKFNKYGFFIHDYFFAKTLDKVRPGGVVAFITSKGTMDKANTNVRRYIAERAELLGAVRLPNTAFKASAGTEVTTDIIFLKKRDRLINAENENWIHTGKTEDGVPLNEYFIGNPHMLLGKMVFDKSMYGNETETALMPDGRDIREALLSAIAFLPENAISESIRPQELDDDSFADTVPADPTVKNYCYTVMTDGNIYQRVDSHMERRDYPKATAERVTGLIEMRVLTRLILTQQIDGCTDDSLRQLQAELNSQYDKFYKKFGAINSRYNTNLFNDDADFPLLSSIEELDEDGNTTKAAIFTKRTIEPEKKITHVDTPLEALPVCLNERGYVDIGYMAELSGKTHEEVILDLRGVIFKNPVYDNPDDESNILNGWETADEYLSGRVKDKLATAELAARDNPIYSVNIEALRAVQPTLLEAHEISARIGVHWIGLDYYRQFILEKFNPPSYDINNVQVHYTTQTGEWTVEKPYSRHNSVEAQKTYGTARMDAYTLFELTLNQKNAKIYDTIEVDGKDRRVINHEQTIAIRDCQKRLKEEFKRWIFDDPERREKLCAVYNNLFNSERSRKYDGSHIRFPGMSPDVTLKQHQRDGVARILYGGNTLLAHVVGSGKTYTMAAAAMELKRLNLAQKPCFVVPNHLVGQWSNEFQRLYPTANILAATKKDFEKQNRQRFCARIATGEWDAVIIGQSSFEKIPVSQERQENRIMRDLDEIELAIIEAKEKDGGSITVKELERARKNLEYQLKTLQDSPKDDLVIFEELGVDALFVDEAHYYKNKFIFTKMNNVAGLSKARAKKSTDMDMKCEFINEQNKSARGLTFATGTPISNSMVEMFTMQSYLQRDELERLGLNHFDNWAANHGEVVSALELAPSGQGYRVKERFAKFVNLPELMAMFQKIADIQTSEMLNLPVPAIMGGKSQTIAVDPSPELKAYTAQLVERSKDIYERKVSPEIDNMLCVTNDGRNAALDMRCIDPILPDYPDSKVNICVQNVFNIYKETEEKKLTQMIFSDLSTPKSKLVLPMKEENGVSVVNWDALAVQDRPFCVYEDIKIKLIQHGVPEKEIAFIHDAATDEQKEKMFSAVRSGEIRVLLGSTQKMGAGTNAQTRLVALHHIDCPYRPSDLEQREGRIVRQGNNNPEVRIFQYVTKNSFDAYLWQIIESKQRFISQVMTGKNPSREMEDINETVLNYAEVKAIATGNPLIKRKMELDTEVQRLRVLESQYRAGRYSLEDNVLKRLPMKLAGLTATVKGLEADIVLRDANSDGEFYMRLGKHEFTERKEAGETLLKAIASGQYADKVIGSYRGFQVIPLEKNYFSDTEKVTLKGELSHTVELSYSDIGSITRIENAINGLEARLLERRADVVEIERQIEASKVQLQRPFEHEEVLQTTLSELEYVNAELDVDKGGDADAVIDEGVAKNEDILGLHEESNDEDEPEM